MDSATLSRVTRKPSTVPAPYRGRLRRANVRRDTAETEYRSAVRDAVSDGVPKAAIARELGITKQVLQARIDSWDKREGR